MKAVTEEQARCLTRWMGAGAVLGLLGRGLSALAYGEPFASGPVDALLVPGVGALLAVQCYWCFHGRWP